MFVGIRDVEFVAKSIGNLNEAADSVARGTAAVEQRTAEMSWQGPDRREFDQKRAALLVELRTVVRTLRSAATDLARILGDQRIASGDR